MERLVAMMAFCEAPLDGTVSPSGAAVYRASATGGGNDDVVALQAAAAANKWPMEKLVATMAFCEAPFDGTSAPSSGAARGDSASSFATGGGNLVALLDAAENKCTVERLVATMAFCEAPFDGTFVDGTSAPSSSGAAGGSGASAGNVPEAGGGQDAAALRRTWLADTKKELMRDKAGTVVDGLAIFETVALD